MEYLKTFEEFGNGVGGNNGANLASNSNPSVVTFDGGDGISSMGIKEPFVPNVKKVKPITGDNAKEEQENREKKRKKYTKQSKIAHLTHQLGDDNAIYNSPRKPSSKAGGASFATQGF